MNYKKLLYTRSSNYRTKFIKDNPGFHGLYMCAYCGRIMSLNKMEVDHIISINLAQKKWIYRKMLKGENVCTSSNLTSSCKKCNRKKSNHGGLWILFGKIGLNIQLILWIVFTPTIIWYIVWFWIYKPYLCFM